MSRAWERNNVVSLFNWQHQRTNPTEGELRIFTISGLVPSVEKGDSWANWLANSIGQGLYGIRTVEIQFALELFEDKDGGFQILKWEDVPDNEWDLLPPITYRIPSADLFTWSLYAGMNWLKSSGIKQFEDTVVGQFEQNKSRNTQVVKDFVNEVLVKLAPVWDNNVVPWLDKNDTLRYVLKEPRESKMREILLNFMDLLKGYDMIEQIPRDFFSIKPRLVLVDVEPLNESKDNVKTLQKKDGTDRYRIVQGTKIKITVSARLSEEILDRNSLMSKQESFQIQNGQGARLAERSIGDVTEASFESQVENKNKVNKDTGSEKDGKADVNLPAKDVEELIRNENQNQLLKIWYTVYNQKTKQYLDLSDEDVLEDSNSGKFVQGPFKRFRLKKLVQDAKDENLFTSTLVINGKDKYGNPIIEANSSLHVNIICEQFAAHEDTTKFIKLKYKTAETPNEMLSVDKKTEDNQEVEILDEVSFRPERNPEMPVRRTHIKVLSYAKTPQRIRNVLKSLREFDEFKNVGAPDAEGDIGGDSFEGFFTEPFLAAVMRNLEENVTEFDILEIKTEIATLIDLERNTKVNFTISDADEVFVNWYLRSKYSKSMIKNMVDQVTEKLIEKKNEILVDKLKIPRQKVEGYGLFNLPETSLLLNQATGMFKLYLCDRYKKQRERSFTNLQVLSRDRNESRSSTAFSEEKDRDREEKDIFSEGKAEDLEVSHLFDEESKLKFVDLDDKEQIDSSKVQDVLATYVRNVFFENVGRFLPNESPLNRRVWIDEAVKENKPASRVVNDGLFLMIIDYFKNYKQKKAVEKITTAKAKKEQEQLQLKKAKMIELILNSENVDLDLIQKLRDFNDENAKTEISILDISNAVFKEMFKTEIDGIVADLVPKISSEITGKVLPAVVKGVNDWIWQTISSNKLKILAALSATAVFVFKPNIPLPSGLSELASKLNVRYQST